MPNPPANFLHVASHGYFAVDAVERSEVVTDLSPSVLTGLALSGANLGPDASGQVPGIITAEELQTVDLTGCWLAVLSACDASRGVVQPGQGIASLHQALQGAGARYVISSLWQVGDKAAADLMSDFYRLMWQDGRPVHEALWGARMLARKRGAPFRDWAGWVLTGY